MKRKNVLNFVIGLMFGSGISGGIINGIIYSNILLYVFGFICLIVFLLYLLWLNEKEA